MAFDEKKANRVRRFIECLKHTKGEFHGKPFKLLPWQDKIISDVFGTVRDDDPTMRQYTTAYIEIPKKQGKSELGAAIALNMLVNDDEWKAEVYSCASDRQQAAIVFDVACDMVRLCPALQKRCLRHGATEPGAVQAHQDRALDQAHGIYAHGQYLPGAVQ